MTGSTGYGLPYPHSDLTAEKRLELYLAQLDEDARKAKVHRAALIAREHMRSGDSGVYFDQRDRANAASRTALSSLRDEACKQSSPSGLQSTFAGEL
jgi:hypothetical protein